MLGDEARDPRLVAPLAGGPVGAGAEPARRSTSSTCATGSTRIGWDHSSPPPELPAEVVEGTRARYIEAHERITEVDG